MSSDTRTDGSSAAPFSPTAPVTRPGLARATPWIVGCALVLQSLDATIVATALPTMARDFGEPVIHLNVVVTAYLLAICLFIPVSGWLAERFGAKRVFIAALVLFTLASLLCGLATDLPGLIAARCLQGAAGAMLTPVGRILVAQRHKGPDLVRAMSFLGMCVVVGPVLGPPLGGFIVQYLSWPWLFFINLPIGLVGAWLATRLTEIPRDPPRRLDLLGLILTGAGSAALVQGLTQAAIRAPLLSWSLPIAAGIGLLASYVVHARRHPSPLIDLTLLRNDIFRAALVGGMALRFGVASSAFLLALMLQIAFGIDPLVSGLVALSAAASSLLMKSVAHRIIAALGFRRLLVVNTVVLSGLLLTWAFFQIDTPLWLIVTALFVAGFARSLQFTSVNTLLFASVKGAQMNAGSSLSSSLFQLTETIGVSLCAIILALATPVGSTGAGHILPYAIAFALIAAIHLAPLPLFWRLPADTGEELRR